MYPVRKFQKRNFYRMLLPSPVFPLVFPSVSVSAVPDGCDDGVVAVVVVVGLVGLVVLGESVEEPG